jgi:hypothetical protein
MVSKPLLLWTVEELKSEAKGYRDDNQSPGDPGYGDVEDFDWSFEAEFPVLAIDGPEMSPDEWRQWWKVELTIDEELGWPRFASMEDWYREKPYPEDPIIIIEGTDARYHIWDGFHRVALCHYVGHLAIPAIVGRRKTLRKCGEHK